MQDELARWVVQARAGDAEAFAALVAACQAGARAQARALLPDPHRVEDAVQEAFVLALGRLEQLQDPAAFPAWLRALVRTAALKLERRRRPDLFDPATDEPPARDDPPERAAQEGEARARVRAALAGLSTREQALIERRYVEGQPLGEIAAALEIPEGTVKRQLFEARERVRARLLGLDAGARRQERGRLRRPL